MSRIGTLSKIFSPGIRVGWVASAAALRDTLVLLDGAVPGHAVTRLDLDDQLAATPGRG